jgi:hypothetical protein
MTSLTDFRGLATHPPLRLFCDPEIAVFELAESQEVQSKLHIEKQEYES